MKNGARYEIPADAEAALRKLNRLTGESTGRLLSEAIGLLDLVLTEKGKGKRILVLKAAGNVFEKEIELNVSVREHSLRLL